MAPRARRAAVALRFEALEPRTLLSGDTATTDGFFVRFQPDLSGGTIQTALKAVGASILQQYPSGPLLVDFGPQIDDALALQWLQSNPLVSYAEPNAPIKAAAVTPNDPYNGQLWGLNNGNNVDIDAPQAWEITQGRNTTLVAVLDTGIDLTNPDLQNRIWVNPNGASGADGYVGDFNGWNFINNNNNVQDNNGHGTHVAGVLAAQGNNGYGVAGVDWYSRIMPVKVLDNRGDGTTEAAVNGIYYAVNNGARVINASWGGGNYSRAMRDAINYAGAHNVVFVSAAGNDGTNNDVAPSYPGSYHLPNQITVAAIDAAGNLASFSDYGVRTVDLVAPGVNITSTIPGGFATYSGTSMATPFVTGVVSLVISLHPEFSAQQLVQRVLATTKPVAGAAGRTVTGGMVDAYNAVNFNNDVSAAAFPLIPNGSSDDTVLAQMLATDDYYAAQGGTDAGFVAGLYRALLSREPDPEGLNYFVAVLQQGTSRFDLVQRMLTINEVERVKVAHWYQDVLGWPQSIAQLRTDPGVQYWASLLTAGYSDNTVRAWMLATDDHFASQGGTNAGFIAGLYRAFLGHEPDPEGLNYFVAVLQQGTSRFDLVQRMLSNDEVKRVKVAHWYQNVMGWSQSIAQLRTDPGVQYWAGFLTNS